MILRCSLRRAPYAHSVDPSGLSRLRKRLPFHGGRRAFSSASGSPGAASESSTSIGLAPFGGLINELDNIAPSFDIQAHQIQILKEPRDFYETLKHKIRNAKRRIFISTLYIGKTEHDLISALRDALKESPQLKVSILTDYLRGTREAPEPSCASLLSTLVAEFGDRVEIRMFHTPNLTGLRKAILPKRINEGWGLQHMKLYGFDDEIILSGANLSTDYFTNRQDRYHLFRSAEVTSFYAQFHHAVCNMSFRLTATGPEPAAFTLSWPPQNAGPSPLANPKGYIEHAVSVFRPLLLLRRAHANPTPPPPTGATPGKTTLYPLFQLTPLLADHAPSTELPALRLLLRSLSQHPFTPAKWTFTAGYFNMTPSTRDLLLSSLQTSPPPNADTTSPHGQIITAHPHANGFFNSPGLSGLLPAAYTLMSQRFLHAVSARRLHNRLSLYEWRRTDPDDNWTYHAKGLWITLPHTTAPQITLVGSSNYTQRSHTLDLEANALLVTTETELQARLQAEEQHLMKYVGARVTLEDLATAERAVGWRVRVALWVTKILGGAL